MLTIAQSGRFCCLDFKFEWLKGRAFVGAVAKGLLFGTATGTPIFRTDFQL